MAFGKKDKEEQPAAPDAAAPELEAPEPESPAAENSNEAPPELDAVPEPAAAAPDPTDALLNMFQTTEAEAEDISLLLDLAGEVDIDDLLEELTTVAAALGIDTSGRVEFEEDIAIAA